LKVLSTGDKTERAETLYAQQITCYPRQSTAVFRIIELIYLRGNCNTQLSTLRLRWVRLLRPFVERSRDKLGVLQIPFKS
jgi:hypothetical protein